MGPRDGLPSALIWRERRFFIGLIFFREALVGSSLEPLPHDRNKRPDGGWLRGPGENPAGSPLQTEK